ncbi:MAG: YkgJ family cysteine cluster protein [Rhodospirillaceae bacterium]
MNANVRRFSCTACGKCCTRGPEMELGEATALADRFIVRLLFKLHSVPPGKASGEADRYLAHFSAHEDREDKRTLHLTISALPFHHETDRCPALEDNRCGIYARRPLACRTVPFHYSRSPAALAGYLDRFVGTPGYLCDTSSTAPVVLRNGKVTDPAVEMARAEALALAQTEKEWKAAIVAAVKSPAADGEEFPRYRDIVRNSDAGGATTVSMHAAWRIAVKAGLLTQTQFDDICGKQAELLRGEIENGDAQAALFRDMLEDYERLLPAKTWGAALRALLP